MKEPRQLQCPPSNNAAFSLIELLVVLAVVLVLTTMYWNHGPSKRDIDLGSCRQNLEKIYLAMLIYTHDNADKYPVSTNALTFRRRPRAAGAALYIRHGHFHLPAIGQSSLPADKTFREWKISYAYYMGRRGE